MAPSPASTGASPNTVDYTLDHTRAHSPVKPDTAADLTLSAETRSDAEDAMRSCALQILEQPIEMLMTKVVGDRELSATSESVSGSTVGKHLRHVLDHFRLFLDAIEQATDQLPLVDYDRRSRSVPIETSAEEALAEFRRTQQRIQIALSSPDGSSLDRPLILQATTPVVQQFRSTVGRECWFICLHSIHHFALARVILNELGVDHLVSKTFGVAPSTLVFREWGRRQEHGQHAPAGPQHDRGDKAKL